MPNDRNLEAIREALELGDYDAAHELARQALADPLAADVVRLVFAAREVAFGDVQSLCLAEANRALLPSIEELDKASEAFASRVPWDNEPKDFP